MSNSMNNISLEKRIDFKKYLAPGYWIIYVFVGALLLLPVFYSTNYLIFIITQCMAFAIFGMAWNLLGGYGSQISWCSSAFVAVGAYCNFIFATNPNLRFSADPAFAISPFLTLPLGVIVSYLMATIIGYGTFRLRGPYFSITTIAFAEAFRSGLQYFDSYTKGSAGLQTAFRKVSLSLLTFRNDRPFYYIFIFLMLLGVYLCYRFTKSKTGYYLSCIKGDEDAAISLGIETFKVKLRAFQVSAMMMSVAGCFYASFLTYISPFSTASFDLSIQIGVVAIVGGVSTLWGPILGAFTVIPLIEITGKLLGGRGSGTIMYGFLLIIVVIFFPKGLINLYRRFIKWIVRRKSPVLAAEGGK